MAGRRRKNVLKGGKSEVLPKDSFHRKGKNWMIHINDQRRITGKQERPKRKKGFRAEGSQAEPKKSVNETGPGPSKTQPHPNRRKTLPLKTKLGGHAANMGKVGLKKSRR